MKTLLLTILLLIGGMSTQAQTTITDDFTTSQESWTPTDKKAFKLKFKKGIQLKGIKDDGSTYILRDFSSNYTTISEIELSFNYKAGSSGIGMIWNYTDEYNYNRFVITTRDQQYFIKYYKTDNDIEQQSWTTNEAIHMNGKTNMIKIQQVGEDVVFYANGIVLYTVKNDKLTNLKLGMMIGNSKDVDCKFNLIKVTGS